MRLVIIESPYAGNVELNTAYARACLRDSLGRGEAPLASHLLYPQVLDDGVPEERAQGIAAGLAWRKAVVHGVEWSPDRTCTRHSIDRVLPCFYIDLGLSSGMLAAAELYKSEHTDFEIRTLFGEGCADARKRLEALR